MITVFIEDFHPTSQTWNRTGKLTLDDFDFSKTYPSKYANGVVRFRFVDEDGNALSYDEAKNIQARVEEKEELTSNPYYEESYSWDFNEEKELTNEETYNNMEEDLEKSE